MLLEPARRLVGLPGHSPVLRSLGSFVALVQRGFDRIQIGGILRALTRDAHRVIAEVHPWSGAGAAPPPPAEAEPVELTRTGAPGVVSAVDHESLIRLARATGAFVEVVPRIGEYVSPGRPVLRLHRPTHASQPGQADRVLVLARQRTIYQDPQFVVRMLVDIAIRALSPAVNDPTTAVQVLDHLEALLVDLLARSPGPSSVVDAGGTPRGSVPGPDGAEYVDLALVEIRRYGAGSPQVARRLRALHEHLFALATGDARNAVGREVRLLDEMVRECFPDPGELALAQVPDRLGLGGRK